MLIREYDKIVQVDEFCLVVVDYFEIITKKLITTLLRLEPRLISIHQNDLTRISVKRGPPVPVVTTHRFLLWVNKCKGLLDNMVSGTVNTPTTLVEVVLHRRVLADNITDIRPRLHVRRR